MPRETITQIQYPANNPSENGYKYLVWGTANEIPFADYREWSEGAWVLNALEVVISFVEIARIPV